MKLLLTSGGLTTPALTAAFKKINKKPVHKLKIAFIITASLAEPGDKQWLFKDVDALYKLGVAQIDLVDIASLPPQDLRARLEWANCLFVEGGNTPYLQHSIERSGLLGYFAELLKTRPYVGVSAGAMVMGFRLPHSVNQQLYPEDSYSKYGVQELLGWRDFILVPHFGAPHMPTLTAKVVADIKKHVSRPIYFLADDSALLFEGDKLTIIGKEYYA